MRNKLIKKLAIVALAAIFLLSMSSYGPAQKGGKGGKGGKEPPELYKVTMSINDGGPGIETLDMGLGCGSEGYFYAEKGKGGGKDLLKIVSKGSETPGPDGILPGPALNMWVTTGKADLPYPEYPIELEGCPFEDGCHGETDFAPWQIFIRFFESQDGPPVYVDGQCVSGCNEVKIVWYTDYEEGPRKASGIGWLLRTLASYDEVELPLVHSTNPFPEGGLELNVPWDTNVIGTFVLIHIGQACGDAEEGVDFIQALPDFNIHLTIERVQ
jgi:hypothetical protein